MTCSSGYSSAIDSTTGTGIEPGSLGGKQGSQFTQRDCENECCLPLVSVNATIAFVRTHLFLMWLSHWQLRSVNIQRKRMRITPALTYSITRENLKRTVCDFTLTLTLNALQFDFD